MKADLAQLALLRLIRLFPNIYMILVKNYYELIFNDLISHISLITKPQSKCLVYKFRAKELQKITVLLNFQSTVSMTSITVFSTMHTN